MTLGFSTYGMKNLSAEQAIDTVADAGFDAVEITAAPDWDSAPTRLSPERRRQLSQRIKDHRLTLSSLMEHLTLVGSKQEHLDGLERLKAVTALGHDLAPEQPPLVQTVLGGNNWEKQKQQILDRLGDWAALAKQSATVIAIKPHRGGAVSQPQQALWLIERLDNTPWIRMVYDYSHYAFRDLPVENTIKTALPITAHIAVKDAVRAAGRIVFRLPGSSGQFDYAPLLSQFHQGGYRGDVSCEVSSMVWKKAGYDPIKAAHSCYQNIAPYFERVRIERG